MTTPGISVDGLSVSYGDVQVLKDISFSATRGEFVAVVGRSGVGKSTLLYAVAGLVKYEGSVVTVGKLGFVFQDYAVFPWLTVRGNVGAGVRGRDRRDKDRIVRRYLEATELTGRERSYPAHLSGGQVQRVAIARALAAEPDLLLCDEPFGALDVYTREAMQRCLMELWERDRKTVLFVTHSVDEAIFLADRILVLRDDGKLIGHRVPFPRPRDERFKFEPEFVAFKRDLLDELALPSASQ